MRNANLLTGTKILLIACYGISIPGLWMMRDNPIAFQASWLFTLFSLVLLLLFHSPWSWRMLYALLLVGALGWIAEVVGTNTGLIFGSYTYGASLGPKLWGTPLSMVVNWMLSVYLAAMVVMRYVKNTWLLAVLASLLLVLYDYILEPVAIRLDMWGWAGGTPPVQNYMAWFTLSFIFVLILRGYVKGSRNPLVLFLLVCQFLFFGALNLMIRFGWF